jgi:hypothetical protein
MICFGFSYFVNHNDFTCETLAFIPGRAEYAFKQRPSIKLLGEAGIFWGARFWVI